MMKYTTINENKIPSEFISISVKEGSNLSKKLTKISESLNTLNYKLHGDEEELLDVKNEKFKISSKEKLETVIKLLYKYVKEKLRMCYSMQKIQISLLNNNISSINKEKRKNISVLVTKSNKQCNKLLFIIPDYNLNAYGVFSKISLLYGGVKKGSMINLIDSASSADYDSMIFNLNKSEYSNLGLNHYNATELIWQNLISNEGELNHSSLYSKVTKLIIIAHQNASLSLIKLMNKYKEDFKNRVKKIILINSSHNSMYEILSPEMKLEFENKATNYIPSNAPLGSLVYSYTESMEGCENRSCGTMTPGLEHYFITSEISKNFPI